jgi:ClpP class serine protease
MAEFTTFRPRLTHCLTVRQTALNLPTMNPTTDTPSPAVSRHSAFELIASQAWAIEPGTLETIVSIARRENDSIESVEARLGRPLQNTRKVTLRENIAIIPLTGPVFRYANLFSDISGATSLEMLARDFATAQDDPAVKHIVLNIDSPGGQATGIAEFAQMIRASRKPVTAYVDGSAASAAYWIAAAAGRIVMSKTAMVGSIGAVLSIDARRDDSKIEIVSSQSPAKRADVTTDAGRAQIQTLIDALAQVFVDDVAAYRGVSTATVLEKFGQGAVFLGADAVSRGMADEVGTLETLIAGLTAGTTTGTGGPLMAEANTPTPAPGSIDRAFLSTHHPDIVAALMNEGAQAERSRILDVEAQALAGHESLIAQLKSDGKTTGPMAAVQILAAEKAKIGAHASALRADAPAVLPPATPANDSATPQADAPVEARAQATWDKDADIRAEFGSFATYLAFATASSAGHVKVLGAKV